MTCGGGSVWWRERQRVRGQEKRKAGEGGGDEIQPAP